MRMRMRMKLFTWLLLSVVKRTTTQPPDNNAIKSLQLHYRYLLRVAQTLCVATQAKGVILAGDNQVNSLNKKMVYSCHEINGDGDDDCSFLSYLLKWCVLGIESLFCEVFHGRS
jgi:hypothetical protein